MNISIILPVYNAACFLEKAVDSALQFPEVKEVLLIEDCSPDNSLEICKKLVAKAKPAARKPAAAATGRMVTTKTSTGKTITYNCSKAGNANKTACK